MDIFKLGDKILSLLEMVFGFWNNQISLVFSMLGQSPVNFKGGGPWAIIEGIEPIFVAVGSSLVVLFFVIGFCSESVDVKEDMRFEVILRMLIRVGLAEWFVANNVTIMKAFFLKILIIVPMGAIAFSTMGGNRTVSHTVVSYCKYFLSVVFEAVTMALAIIVCNAFVSAGLPSFTGSYADWAQTLIYLCEMTFTIAMTVGSVKGAQSLTSKAFGL